MMTLDKNETKLLQNSASEGPIGLWIYRIPYTTQLNRSLVFLGHSVNLLWMDSPNCSGRHINR
jgi:hypothetical protein